MVALACVSAQGRGATDKLLAAVVGRLQSEGTKVVGALRAARPGVDRGSCDSDLWLLPGGPVVRITQDLGPGSEACRMDAAALKEAAGMVSARLATGMPDLVVVNKFGLSESEGRGFRALIAEALSRGVPVLVGVSDAHRAAFERFADGMSTVLSPDVEAVWHWCRAAAETAAASAGEA